MKAERSRYACVECGAASVQWLGRCPACGNFDTMREEAAEAPRRSGSRAKAAPLPLSSAPEEGPRILSGIGELDRVLGGGAVPGSLVLLGGEPGIGKSTLLLQAAAALTGRGAKVMLVSGEESAAQIASRARRIGALDAGLFLLCETDLAAVLEAARELAPQILVIDSMQTMRAPELDTSPGGVNQLRECVSRMQALAKEMGAAVFLVGHVTKEGMLAGPRAVEHMVDCVLHFEGDRFDSLRLLRAAKNRFGSVSELGIFEMTGRGLSEVEDPSRLFADEREEAVSGTATVVVMEGRRPLLVEVQALVVPSHLPAPKRVCTGMDQRRLAIDVAVLERKAGVRLNDRDVYVGICGGLRVNEPALDLGVCAAIASSRLERTVPPGTVFLGEVSLTGEVRPVSRAEERAQEAARLGCRSLVLSGKSRLRGALEGLELLKVRDVAHALERLGIA